MAVGRDRCACVGGMNMHVCVSSLRSDAGDYPSVFVTKLLRCDIVRVEWVHDCPAEQCACVELS